MDVSVLRVSVVFQLFDFQLRIFLEVHNKNVLLPQSRANIQPDMSGCWRFSKRTIKQAQIHTGFHHFTKFVYVCVAFNNTTEADLIASVTQSSMTLF